jgi:hypothetical protein
VVYMTTNDKENMMASDYPTTDSWSKGLKSKEDLCSVRIHS